MADALPKVSIGLPVYNGEKYLEEALDSILAQTFGNFELIISDNGSSDRTRDICLKYAQKDRRIRYHRNSSNLGAAPNHNFVFRLAKGDYFKWAGYDDKISADFLSKCVDVLDRNPDVVLCMPKTALIDERGEYLGEFEYKAVACSHKPKERFRNFVLRNESGNYVYGLMRKDLVAQTSLQGSYPSSDLVFLAALTLYGRYHILPEPLYFRRRHSEQSTKGALNTERMRIAWFDTSLEHRILLPKWLYLLGYLAAIRKSPLNTIDRICCYGYMIRWVLRPEHLRALGKDVLLALQKIAVGSAGSRKLGSAADD